MFTRTVIPITLVALAGCSRQPTSTNNAPRPVQPAYAQPASTGTAGSNPAAVSLGASPSNQPAPPAARIYPVVSAEVADTPPPLRRRPSAFAPRERPEIEHAVKTRTQTIEPAVTIPAGTRLRVRLAETLDTKTARPGDRFLATLEHPVTDGSRVIVPRGTRFEGVIDEAKSSGQFRGRAVIVMRLTSFRLQGTTHRIATSAATEVSGNHKKRNLVLMGGGPAAGASIGAIAGGAGALIGAGAGAVAGTTSAFFTGKKNVKIPVETPMVFSLRTGVAVRRS